MSQIHTCRMLTVSVSGPRPMRGGLPGSGTFVDTVQMSRDTKPSTWTKADQGSGETEVVGRLCGPWTRLPDSNTGGSENAEL